MFDWLRKKAPPATTRGERIVDEQLHLATESAGPVGASALYRAGRFDDADIAAEAALNVDPNDIEALLVKGTLACDNGRAAEALRLLTLAADLESNRADVRIGIGRALVLSSRPREARAAFELAQTLDRASGEPMLHLALMALRGKREDEAIVLLESAARLEPGLAHVHFHLGEIYRGRRRNEDAEKCYRRAISAHAGHAEALSNLGALLKDRGQLQTAAEMFEQALEANATLAPAAFNLAMLRVDQRLWADAARLLGVCVSVDSKNEDAHYWLGNALMGLGRVAEARTAYKTALRLHGGFLQALWGVAMAQLPAVAQSAREQAGAAESFRREVATLRAWFQARPGAEGFRAVGAQQPFYLAYVPGNHRKVLSEYGALAALLMANWARKVGVPRPVQRSTGGARMRIAIVSAHVHSHSVWHALVRGWVEFLDAKKFEIELFYTGMARDVETEWAQRRVAKLHQGLGEWTKWAKAISDGCFDIVIYPELGMDSTTVRLAALRLARVQLAAWGHPITTGLPTIDGFISAEAFEPSDGATHYSEKLIKLPRLGCCYRPFSLTPAVPDLAALGVSRDDRLLLCAGTPFKYAPQDDALLIEIAKRCRPCKLVFFRALPPTLSSLLEERLRKAFESEGLAFDDFVRFIPWQPQAAFFGLLDRTDVYLDSIGFSGFNTAMQAVERGAPIVAMEGQFMRGRFASAILRQLKLDDWVATTGEEYVERVARLCSDASLRNDVRKQIMARWKSLVNDTAAVSSFGTVLVSLVAPESR